MIKQTPVYNLDFAQALVANSRVLLWPRAMTPAGFDPDGSFCYPALDLI
jgi:hypothetical protein